METFKNYIDEFVDWVTGEDTSEQEFENKTRVSSTGGLPVSGGSIRELLQTRLKNPFVYYEDTKNGLYRLFSSESTKARWIRMNTIDSPDYDPENSSKLELFNFVRPSDLVMTYQGLNPNPRYIINGDVNSAAANLSFTVYLSKEQGGATVYESDSFTVTYKIIDSSGVEHTSAEEKNSTFLNSSTPVTKNIYDMLTIGQNTVTVNMKARNSSAGNSITFPVYLIEFELSSTFNYAHHWDPNQSIQIPVSVRRSDASLTLEINVYSIPGGINTSASGTPIAQYTVNNQETNPTHTFNINNIFAPNEYSTDHIKHMFKIEARMYNQDASSVYYSNVLFYDFVVASNTIGITNAFTNIGYSVSFTNLNMQDNGRPILHGTQYEIFQLPWAYYTDRDTTQQTVDIEWAIRTESTTEPGVYTYSPITIIRGQNNAPSEPLKFIPDFYTTSKEGSITRETYLVSLLNGQEVDVFPLNIVESSLQVRETTGYNLKLTAFGRSNTSPDKDQWIDPSNNVTTTFTNIAYDNNSGWNDNAFVTSGTTQYAIINYNPIPKNYNLSGDGKTIEIDFKPEKVVNDGDVLIIIGDVNGGHIKITTNEAGLYNGVNPVKYCHTNYKANERIKLTFVFNPVNVGVDSNLFFIINNGILERAGIYGNASDYTSPNSNIKIGGSQSGVRVYNIRAYNKALTSQEALNNYIYDCDNKAEVINRNDIYLSSVIDYTKVKNKIDTILITGDLTAILTQGSTKDESESTVTFKRECITDPTKNFTVTNGMARKHGQSTLNYPITSIKLWTNKSATTGVATTIDLSESQRAEGLNKNRYIMKPGAIPANKFVLQANYADSSGTHNGALLRLIQDTWYNANFGTVENPIYRLRTAPQLFASGYTLTHNNAYLHEDENPWTDGYGVGKAANKTWPQISGNKPFPYIIRNAPDSFPCAVFYQNGPDDGYHFLGQYVFMDDKKSDYIYGERSIYHFGKGNDPFVLKTENTRNGPLGQQDITENCVWDNKNVLRIEVVLPNNTLTSYMNFNVTDTQGNTHACTDIKYDDETGLPIHYWWEDYFEMIYPDEDDVAKDDTKDGLTKYDSSSKFVKKVTPFINFLKWITDCKNNYSVSTDWWNAGTYSSTQQAFEATAHNHLDLYKVAAYYIFFLRFGLVDSVERNAQLKTYDGQHWHYEPWDMDIALGNTNQGSLVLNPPMNRNSFEPGTTTYAFSGKSLNTSNVLWDCLENWDYWSNTLVPDVAQVLYNAGLTYDNIINMFDKEYAEKWSENMFNQSGHFKYIENGGSDWLAWLQGARTSHRHWWVSTSMNYYDAKWSCGSFNEHRVRIFSDKAATDVIGTDIITIYPTSDTFFKIAQQEGRTSLGVQSATRISPAVFDVSTASFSTKDPSYIYGGTFIESIDLSCLSEKLKAADFSLCYDDVLGAPIKQLNVGLPYTVNSATSYTGKVSGTECRLTGYDTINHTDAFENLQFIDITGQGKIEDTLDFLYARNRKNVTDFYAIGTGITTFTSSSSGNKFNVIKIPAVTTTTYDNSPSTVKEFSSIKMVNSSWNTIEFWNTTKSGSVQYVRDEHNELVLDEDNNPILMPSSATFTKTTVPYQLRVVEFEGSTASNECAGQFVLDWISSIEANLAAQNPSYTQQDLYDILNTKTLKAQNINWGVPGQTLSLSYNDVAKIAQFNYGNNAGGLLTGYIMLSDQTQFTAAQLNNLTQWFGPTVFTKSAKSSHLVIDQNLDYTRITTSGTETINDEICLYEGTTAALAATKFMLSESDSLQFDWSVQLGQNQSSVGIDRVNSVRLISGDDGSQRITAEASGVYGDYYITVTARYSGINYTLTIKVLAVTLPEDIQININTLQGNTPRRFYLNDDIRTQMSQFANATYDENNPISPGVYNLRESYVMFNIGQSAEFYPTKVDGDTPSQIDITQYTYRLNGQLIRPSDPENGDGFLYYSVNNAHNGITFRVGTLPNTLTVYTFTVDVVVGTAKHFTRNLNIILYDDSTVIHRYSTSPGVQAVLNAKHTSLYNNALDNYYKSDLLSLTGTLDFSTNASAIGTVNAEGGESLLKYLPNITQLDFNGCSSLVAGTLGILNNGVLIFEAMPYLTTINLSNTSVNYIINFTNCVELTTINLQNTTAGIILAENNKVTYIQLGSPTQVNINSPISLNPDNVTIQSSSNLTSISLGNIRMVDNYNNTYLKGYMLFNKIYNPS